MAEDKKSFLLYADYISIVKKLPDGKAGKLLKTILAYVNDENPTVDDPMVDLAFEPIKLQLKRDLKKYEKVKQIRSESGKLGGKRSGESRRASKQNEAKRSKTKQVQANEADTVNGTVNGTVTDTVTDTVTVTETSVRESRAHTQISTDEKKADAGETHKADPGTQKPGAEAQGLQTVVPAGAPLIVQSAHLQRYKTSLEQVDGAAMVARQLGLIPATHDLQKCRAEIFRQLHDFDPNFVTTYPNGDYQKYGFQFKDWLTKKADEKRGSAGSPKVSPPSQYKTAKPT